jgi:hypothetical protein
MKRLLSLVILQFLLVYCAAQTSLLEANFLLPPKSLHTSVYWYWMSGDISREGVIKDLEAMKKAGINRAFIGNIYDEPFESGRNVQLLSEEWWAITHAALKKAGELDIEIGMFNSPGWSQAGGPWNKDNQSMRYLSASETSLKGPLKIDTLLKRPEEKFQDVKLIAFPVPKKEAVHLQTKEIKLPKDSAVIIDLSAPAAFTARSITVHPFPEHINANFELQAYIDGGFRTIRTFQINWHNLALNVGFQPFAPVCISLEPVRASAFRIIAKNNSEQGGISGLEISSIPRIENFAQKTFAKMFQDPLPQWDYYMWRKQPEVEDSTLLIDPATVKDISSFLSADGRLVWEVPPGNWKVLRTGMTPTGVTNSPAGPDGTGPEVDKMNKKHVAAHFDAFIGKILQRIPAEDRRTFRVVVQDSYETGGQNFTDDFLPSFKKQFGYDALPYLPVYFGHVVGNQQNADRFLWDMRRFVADKVAYEYVGGFREQCHRHGLKTWLENYGHWGFPAEFLQYGGQSDEVAGEFWVENELGNIENRAASSCAHIYGKNLVSAESNTSGGPAFSRSPRDTKQRMDKFFAEGINNTLLHVYIHQPDSNRYPGTNAWFGTEYTRTNTWFTQLDLYTDYIKRCNWMLQQGLNIADITYFIGEDVPKMTGKQDPELPPGYQFDYINAEVLLRDAFMKDGRITLPHGTSYRVLVLPKIDNMRPELLLKIQQLVKDGAIVLGPKPTHSPSLQNQPMADQLVRQTADELWGNRNAGKGVVFTNADLAMVLRSIELEADCKIPKEIPFNFIHRRLNGKEIYFLTNQSAEKQSAKIRFRVSELQPELWNPITGMIHLLPEFTPGNSYTDLPISLDANESCFIVFQKDGKPVSGLNNYSRPLKEITLTNPWKLDFRSPVSNPPQLELARLQDLSAFPDQKIKYFSGTMIYTTSFMLSAAKKEEVYLDLGKIGHMAKVWLNGQYIGGVWTAPFRIKLTPVLRSGKNELRIEVVNNWANRLIGDKIVADANRETRTRINPYKENSALQPAGLIGPVKLLFTKNNQVIH